MRPALLTALSVLLLPATASSQTGAVRGSSSGTLLIGNKGENSLSLVDLRSGREVRRVPTGRMPHEIALSPDGRRAAVVAYGGRTIEIYALPGAERVQTVELGENARPHGLLWLPDNRLLATAEGRDALAIVDMNGRTPRVREMATGAEGSHMVAVSPDRTRAYVANMGAGTVGVFDLRQRARLREIPAGSQPEGLAVSPDGRRLWVADRAGDTLRVIDTGSFRELAALPTGKTPIRVAISPDGRHAVTSDFGAAALSLFDARTMRPVGTIPVGRPGSQQVTILFSRDGRRLYVAETGTDTVAELDFPSGRVLRRLPAGKNGDGLGLSPLVAAQ